MRSPSFERFYTSPKLIKLAANSACFLGVTEYVGNTGRLLPEDRREVFDAFAREPGRRFRLPEIRPAVDSLIGCVRAPPALDELGGEPLLLAAV